MDNLTNNIKRIMIIFLVVFFVLISYLAYFTLVKGPEIVTRPDNRRMWDIRNKVVRGTIYDRNGKELSISEKKSGGNDYKRVYKGGAVTAHALGYYDPQYGITGLENLYDSYLSSNISASLLAWIGNGFKEVNKKGDDVYTTIDYQLQKTAYDALGSLKGSIVVLKVDTGEILATVSKPSYDPNSLSKNWKTLVNSKSVPLLNRSVSGLYPPGSTFKVVTAVSALENIDGIKNESFNDKGKLNLGGGYTLSNDNGKVLGQINLEKAFVKSSNVYFGSMGIRLENDLFKTAQNFRFNRDIPSDGIVIDKSRFPKYKNYEKGNMAQSGIGQAEVLSTPIQMALVAQTIANDGVMMKPTLVNKITDYNGSTVQSLKPSEIDRVTSAQYASEIRKYMRDVVSKGTGTRAQVSGVQVCGKTGTAQHIESKIPHSWFIGFAPYKNPQIAIAVIVEEGGYGGVAAAKISQKVMSRYFHK
ncbi:peptidoglycan D,D-transpeptidase FtsI family protein [Ruminiclostridium cellulolyticum]|uniref:Penicillin-binding protein transpeptidase n=1 Tax=Ruminiclostridium cellulolyticum (strain ATCC 35319 / DSM 5812 / JCM 6584 / H10) TaxID=394503 RepID=B8I639_RUMCH|nr:penicillin-binding transpeptidase domain-containing protein [Ruminiclostridium cellulolyticum]ACL76804.1 penicillin-binding protein transpeptidase [Ruminiclostridium cellulolyticum H10]